MKQAHFEELVAELGGGDTRESITVWFSPSFHPECGVVLVRGGEGWRGWWVATLRVTGGDPVLSWLDPTTSREPLPLDGAHLDAIARRVREALAVGRAASGEIVLDGCSVTLSVATGGSVARRSAHLSHRGEGSVRSLASALCELADTESRWDATRNAFASLRRYLA